MSVEREEIEAGTSGIDSYLLESRSVSFGIVAVLPLLAFYELGIHRLDATVRNGADYYLKLSLAEAIPDWSLWVWWGFVAAAVGVAAWAQFRRGTPFLRYWLGLCLEGVLLGLLLGPVILVVHEVLLPNSHVLHLGAAEPAGGDTLDAVLSLGAGVYEEIVFRLLLLSGLYVLLLKVFANDERGERLRRARWSAAWLAVLISGLLFSAFHYVGAGADVFVAKEFAYRAIGGVLLGMIFIARGFGAVVYTHAAYDLLVFFFFPLVDW